MTLLTIIPDLLAHCQDLEFNVTKEQVTAAAARWIVAVAECFAIPSWSEAVQSAERTGTTVKSTGAISAHRPYGAIGMQKNEGLFFAHGELNAGIPKSLLDSGGGFGVDSHPLLNPGGNAGNDPNPFRLSFSPDPLEPRCKRCEPLSRCS